MFGCANLPNNRRSNANRKQNTNLFAVRRRTNRNLNKNKKNTKFAEVKKIANRDSYWCNLENKMICKSHVCCRRMITFARVCNSQWLFYAMGNNMKRSDTSQK